VKENSSNTKLGFWIIILKQTMLSLKKIVCFCFPTMANFEGAVVVLNEKSSIWKVFPTVDQLFSLMEIYFDQY
jgi:hypothetical protein